MRNEDGIILRNEMTIGARTDLECRSFGTFEGGASVEEKDRWERFVAMALPPNPVRGDPRLLVTDEGLPKLPDVDNSWTRDDIVAVLESFFRLSWLHMRPKEAGLQWGTVTAEPTRYLNAPWDSICVRDPTTFSLVEVIVLYTQLLDAQGKGTPFRFRSGEDSVGRESDAGVPHVVSGTTTAGARTTNPQTPTMGIRVVNVFSSPVHKALTSQRKDRHSATPAERNTNASSGSTLTDTLFSVREEGESDLEDGAPAGNAGSGSHQVSRRASVSESGVGAASTANRMEEQAGSRAESGERLVGGGPPGGVEGEPADAVGGEGEETSVRAEEPHASIPSPRVRKRTSVAVRESGGPSGIEDVEYDVAASVPKRRRSGRGKASDVEDDVVDGSLPKRRRSGRGKGWRTGGRMTQWPLDRRAPAAL
ncbi:hypothetical protein C2E23DRAFT_897540 [Lenzites betulinus]|nr:hypothetical protein C2E23DRAFT_897540 [Lenzites betulinus]